MLKLQRLDSQTLSSTAAGQRLEDKLTSGQCQGLGSSFSVSTEDRENKNQEASIADWPVALFITYSIHDVLHVERRLRNLSAKSDVYSVIAVVAVFHST